MKIDLLYFMPMSRLTLKIERPAFGGSFIARHDGKIVMVQGPTAPGERVEATLEHEKRDYLTATVSKI
ncbi:MAG: TRAM domain-containing protein, partial [Nitrospiraceae bacterium]